MWLGSSFLPRIPPGQRRLDRAGVTGHVWWDLGAWMRFSERVGTVARAGLLTVPPPQGPDRLSLEAAPRAVPREAWESRSELGPRILPVHSPPRVSTVTLR